MEKHVQLWKEIENTVKTFNEEKALRCCQAIENGNRIFLAGQGRSGLMMKAFAMRLMQLGFSAHVVGETTTPAIGEKDVLMIGSGSGETSSLVAMAQKAKGLGCSVVLITTSPDSTVGRLSEEILPIKAQVKSDSTGGGSIQPMGSLFEQALILVLDTLVLHLMDRTEQSGEDMYRRHANLE
ncbi:MAG TPA: 6-phospho-3-hexuloisomerase [Eubacteriaceae bacterium]|nr:6-phospho-3-hexuloisomerase [Eubacteriaceae bacterium]